MESKNKKLGRKPYRMVSEAYNDWTSIGLFEEKGKKAYWLDLKNGFEDLQIEITSRQQMSILGYDLLKVADKMIRISENMKGRNDE